MLNSRGKRSDAHVNSRGGVYRPLAPLIKRSSALRVGIRQRGLLCLLRPNERSLGLTIIELLIVVMIMATLATLGVPLYASALDNARVAKAMADIRIVEKEIFIFQVLN